MSKGRGNGNAITMNEAVRLDINSLIRGKNIQQNKVVNFISSWTNGAKINIISVYNNEDIYLRLFYKLTNQATSKSKDFDYKIYIERVKSNLGIGANHYFICPESGNRCKILYLCYGAERFKCRKAYNKCIYYSSQLSSKTYDVTNRYFHFEKLLNELNKKRIAKDYKGKPTKRKLRTKKLKDKIEKLFAIKEKQLENWLNKYLIPKDLGYKT
jgi:hypothetical protein